MLPFLKWAGGKRWLVPKIVNHLPPYKRYFEPFFGSGALYFALQPSKAYLSDSNIDLINCYRQIKNQPRLVIRILNRLRINKTTYYKVRDSMYANSGKTHKSAYFIYLNKTCWNGLYRVNDKGKFNVPIGTINPNKKIFEEENLIAASKLLKKAVINTIDFEEATKTASRGDLVYLDPPYITTHLTNGFIKYNSTLFSHADELRLAKHAKMLTRRGVHVIVSNAAHPSIESMYDGPFYKAKILRNSMIAADSEKRAKFNELLLTSFPMNKGVYA